MSYTQDTRPLQGPHQPYAPPPQPPVKKKMGLGKKILLGGVGLLALTIVGSCAAAMGGGGGEQAAVPQPSQSAEAPKASKAPAKPAPKKPAAPAPKPAVPGIGDAVQSGDMKFTVTKVQTGVHRVGTEYLGKDAQGQFVLVTVKVENTGNDKVTLFSDSQKLLDAKGREFSSDSEASIYAKERNLILEDINPGNTAKGVLVFDLPKQVKPVKAVLSGGLLAGDAEVQL